MITTVDIDSPLTTLTEVTTDMRVSTIGLCTLACLVTQELSHEANATSNSELPESPPINNLIFLEKAVEPELAKSVASPETLGTQQFSASTELPSNEKDWNSRGAERRSEEMIASIATLPQTFECKRLNNIYTTVPAGTKAPFIRWRSQEFSKKGFTPKRRCEGVTNKLNRVIAENGGTLRGLWLTMGRVNRYRVLCHVNNRRSGCNRDNVLLTLSVWNRGNPSEVMARLLNLGVTGRGYSVQESEEQPYVSLESLVNELLTSEGDTNISLSSSPNHSASSFFDDVKEADFSEP